MLLLVKDTPRRSVLGVERLLEHAYNATSGVYSECRRNLRDTRESQEKKKALATTCNAQREWVNGDIMHVANDSACPLAADEAQRVDSKSVWFLNYMHSILSADQIV